MLPFGIQNNRLSVPPAESVISQSASVGTSPGKSLGSWSGLGKFAGAGIGTCDSVDKALVAGAAKSAAYHAGSVTTVTTPSSGGASLIEDLAVGSTVGLLKAAR